MLLSSWCSVFTELATWEKFHCVYLLVCHIGNAFQQFFPHISLLLLLLLFSLIVFIFYFYFIYAFHCEKKWEAIFESRKINLNAFDKRIQVIHVVETLFCIFWNSNFNSITHNSNNLKFESYTYQVLRLYISVYICKYT